MAKKNETISFKSSEKISRWLEKILKHSPSTEGEINRSDLIRNQLENAITHEQGYYLKYAYLSDKAEETMQSLYNKVINPDSFFNEYELYFMFGLAHRVYYNYQNHSICSQQASSCVKAFKHILIEAYKEGWKPKNSHRYYLGNLRGEATSDEISTYEQLLRKCDSTLTQINKAPLYCAVRAEYNSRNIETILPSITISIESLNAAVRPFIKDIFLLAAKKYYLEHNKTFINTKNSRLAPCEHKETKTLGRVSLETVFVAHLLVCYLSIDLGDFWFKIEGDWNDICEWKSVLVDGNTSSKLKIREQPINKENKQIIDFTKEVSIALQPSEFEALKTLIQNLFESSEKQKYIQRLHLYYGKV